MFLGGRERMHLGNNGLINEKKVFGSFNTFSILNV